MRSRIINKYKELRGQIYFDLARLDRTVFLAGSARSGTTWVQDIIDYNNEYRVIFEPFHSEKTAILKNWNNRQYLRPENTDSNFLIPAEKILQGKIRSVWTDKFNKKIIARKRLIKDIRTNLSLKWIDTQFPEIRTILLLRHPCAVANSRMKLGWQDHLGEFLKQDDLIEDYLHPYLDIINNTTDTFDRQIIMWCIENKIPLKQFNNGEILVVFYEDLCVDAQKVIEDISSYLVNEYPKNFLDQISKPSALSRKDSAINKGTDLIGAWKNNTSKDQLDRAIKILKAFGMDKVYNEELMPLTKSNEVLDVF